MITSSRNPATPSACTSLYQQDGPREHRNSGMLEMATIISASNHRRRCYLPRIRSWWLRPLLLLTLLLGAVAQKASYESNGETDLLFDTRIITAMQKKHKPLNHRNDNWTPSLLPRYGSQTPMPSPFDSSLGDNFTSSTCPTFFKTFLHDTTFQNCLPFSLLLQTSTGFFDATRSKPQLPTILEATCNVDYEQCSALMAQYAQQIQSSSNCHADLKLQNPLVEQAFNGFIAYDPMYQAGCLKDDEGNFCYADAVTNLSSPTSGYIYYLPLGMQLPTSANPTCNSCLRDTMEVFATYAGDAEQPLSSDYVSAAQHVETYCAFRHVKVAAVNTSGASPSLKLHDGPLLRIIIFVLLFSFF